MGYTVRLEDSNFFIRKENFHKVVEIIHSIGGGKQSFDWVDRSYLKTDNLLRIFDCWRWEARMDGEGNISDLRFNGQSLGDDLLLFQYIAPYVLKGSFIQMRGEDSEIWRWFFDGENCNQMKPNYLSWS